MKPLTCAAARRRLQAFHDHELPVHDQIAVGAHLDACAACAAWIEDLRAMRTALHAMAFQRLALSNEEAAAFTATVVSRRQAEDDASMLSRVRLMFDDMHLVYAGVGAAAAAVVCVVIMLSMMRFATRERPDSLAAIVTVLATPIECESSNDLDDNAGCRARWAERFQRANETAEQDAVFTLDAVVTRQGRLANFAVLRASGLRGRRSAIGQVELIDGLCDAVSRSRLDAGASTGSTRGNTLRLVEHATVRANKQPVALDVPLPPKKRAASLNDLPLAAGA
ncbi:MAG: zf-HC2 domain-containing protein [Acidobacteria bacterium]|nr:zf-HC2 domain-containing protein [Acidobacteriota bacterium]